MKLDEEITGYIMVFCKGEMLHHKYRPNCMLVLSTALLRTWVQNVSNFQTRVNRNSAKGEQK